MKELFYRCFIIFVICSFCCNNQVLARNDPKMKLKLVQIFHRHGTRGPLDYPSRLIPTFVEKNAYPEALTAIGKQQLKAFGSALKSYTMVQNLLDPVKYNKDQLYMRSVDLSRCLESSSIVLNQLYNEKEPIPIDRVSSGWDILLKPNELCASYVMEEGKAYSDFTQMMNTKYSDLLHTLHNWTGIPSEIPPPHLITLAVDYILVSKANDISIDPIINEQKKLILNLEKKLVYDTYAPKTNDPRGSIGEPLLSEILNNINRKLTGSSDFKYNVLIYSAQDVTLRALAFGLGLVTTKTSVLLLPKDAMSFFIELWIDEHNVPIIKLKIGEPSRDEKDGAWHYQIDDSPLFCRGVLTYACPLSDFRIFLEKQMVPNGCCVRTEGFSLNGCDHYQTKTSNMHYSCRIYRQFCPKESCGTNQTFDANSMNCRS